MGYVYSLSSGYGAATRDRLFSSVLDQYSSFLDPILPRYYYVGWFVFVISRHFEAGVEINTYCTQPSLPNKRKVPDKSFIEDAAVLSGSDDDEDEEDEEDKDISEYFRDDFVVDNGAEEEEDI